MQWTDGRSKRTISFVKRSTIREGMVAVGEKVKVIWGKSKKAYDAKVLSVGSIPPAPPSPRGRATTEEEPFAFQLAVAAPCVAAQAESTSHADQHGIDALADALAGLEARLLCRLQALEDKLTALQREVLETCTALPPPAPLPSLPPAMLMIQEPQTNLPPPSPVAPLQSSPPSVPDATTPGPTPTELLQETETPTAVTLESFALQDVTSRCNVAATRTQGGYVVPADVVATALFGCRSRRNLAARLAAKVFTVQERQASNCRGVMGKTPLDVFRVKAINAASMYHFALQRLETQVVADKEMRTAIDEVCRKAKRLPAAVENCQGSVV